MFKKSISKETLPYLALILFFFSSFQSIYAVQNNKQIVRVAYFNVGDYYNEISDGIVESYDTEYLNKIEKYSNFDFQYVNCGIWSNALKMLERHEVDLVGTVQWNKEREEKYEFCLEGYAYTIGELATLKSKNFIYEDYEAIGKSVIGCTSNYVRMKEMNKLFLEHNISPKFKYYSTQLELENALASGEIDLIAANSHTLKNDLVAVEKFTFSPFYFISWKGNENLVNKIDDAIININIQEPSTNDYLMKKYFSAIMGAPLTKEELDLIAENKVYDVYFDAITKPTSWYDKKTNTMQGGLIEVCNQISEKTGLKLNPVPMIVGKTVLDKNSVRTTTVYNGVKEKLLSKPGETNAFIIENFNLYSRTDKKVDLSKDTFTVAIVEDRVHIKDYINETYPNAIIKGYPNPEACLKAVQKKHTDFTYLDCRIADNAIVEKGIVNVKEFPIAPQQQGIAIIFPNENKDLLVSIVNKGLEFVDQEALSESFVKFALETRHAITIHRIVQDYFGLIIFILSMFFVFLICFAILFTYAKVMEKQKDKIAKADADRTEFFGRMSHDMRTPMNGIIGMLELSISSNKIGEIHENLKKAKAAGEYMLSLINDTLDLQRLESKKLKLEKNIENVTDYYNEIFSIMKVSAKIKKINFNVTYKGIDKNCYIEIDSVRVKQIFSNLISNAIKFTPEGGGVEIIIESLGETGNIAHRKYQIRDTGVGMSEDFIKNRLFKPYSQESNQLSTQLTGSGLGMAITKNLVEIMGGRLEVESALGEGTTFTVYLDVKTVPKEIAMKSAQKKAKDSRKIYSELSGKKILLCEDHPLNAEIAKRLLEKIGCTVDWVENGKLGVEHFAQSTNNQFDAILMDIRMPVMDGLTATKEIRLLPNSDAATIPIIAMTANAYESDIQNCKNAGMTSHLAKPVNPQKMYEELFRLTVEKKA